MSRDKVKINKKKIRTDLDAAVEMKNKAFFQQYIKKITTKQTTEQKKTNNGERSEATTKQGLNS